MIAALSAFSALNVRLRVVAWYSLVLVAVLGAFAVFIVWQQGRIGTWRVDRELDALSGTLENVLRDELGETDDPIAAAKEARTTLAAPGRPLAILDEDGRVLAEAWNGLDARPDAFRAQRRPVTIDGRTFVLVVAVPIEDILRERRAAWQAMLVGLPIVLLLAAAGGWWLASSGPLVAQLRESLRVQRQFMADASHELRTPVSVIRSAADVALLRDERDADEYRDAIAIVATEAKRLSGLVDDMLVLARADAGGYPLHPVNLYLNDLVDECRRAVDVLARERGVSVRAAIPADVLLRGDENLLRRMLLNVIQNAVTHTRGGGTVTVDVAPNGRQIAIRVHDEGAGIPEADRVRIFDRFVQLDAARRSGGAGLGLPIARWIAEAHAGSLELEASGPAGSTFLIGLPLGAHA
jgi:signal transduction histidine kinase